MIERTVGGLDWGGAFGRDPIAVLIARRKGEEFWINQELKIKRAVWPQVALWIKTRGTAQAPLDIMWCGADQPAGVAWLQDNGIRAQIVADHGPGSVDAGMTLIAQYARSGHLHISEECPQLLTELRSLRTSQSKPDDHLIDALRYLLISERHFQEVIEQVPPEKQATIVYVPGKGFVDNPRATHAHEMAGYGEDPFFATWTDAVDTSDEAAMESARAFCELMGCELPDFLKNKPKSEGF